jgi:hypothetical protein
MASVMEPPAGIEPATSSLRVMRTTDCAKVAKNRMMESKQLKHFMCSNWCAEFAISHVLYSVLQSATSLALELVVIYLSSCDDPPFGSFPVRQFPYHNLGFSQMGFTAFHSLSRERDSSLWHFMTNQNSGSSFRRRQRACARCPDLWIRQASEL